MDIAYRGFTAEVTSTVMGAGGGTEVRSESRLGLGFKDMAYRYLMGNIDYRQCALYINPNTNHLRVLRATMN